MAFYIQPPTGDITISQLENWAVKRLQFLLDIFGCHGNMDAVKRLMESPSSVEQSDCLIEGSTKDAVSHFILRLACAGDVLTAKVFVESETVLFLYRFTNLTEAELLHYLGCLRRFQKQLTKHLESVDPENVSVVLPAVIMDICQFFKMLTETFDWRTLIHHYSLKSEEHFVRLPFKFALEMVSKRQVVLNRGKAIVPCTLLPQLFRWFFQNWLTYGIQLAKTQRGRFIEDSRMKRISAICRSLIQRRCHNLDAGHSIAVLGNLVATDIDHLVKGFPPCMIRLHESLRRNHRLKHYSRVVYILFLKDLGLPVNEAVSFWRQEYSQPFPVSSSYHGCRHSWHKEEKRLTYSIHHLYGLKGSRQKYSSHSCVYIQNHDWGPAEEASCPFYHFDNLKLQESLASTLRSTAVWPQIHELVERKQPCRACSVFLAAKIQHHMPETKDPCSNRISPEEGLCDQEISTTDAVIGSEKNMVLQMGINCGCARDSILSVSTKSDSFEVCQFLETRNDDEVMMETDMSARLHPFKKPRTNRSLTHSLNVDSHEMPKPNARLEIEKKCLKSNLCQYIFSSDERFTLPDQLPEDSGYDSVTLLSPREFQPVALSNADHSGLCQGEQLVKKVSVFNDQDKTCHLMNCKIEMNCTSTAHQQKTQLAEKCSDAKDLLLRVAVDTRKVVKQNMFNTKSINSWRRKAHQCLETETSSALKNQPNAAGCNSSWKNQSSLNKTVTFELKKVVTKPVDFFQSYNDLVKQFRKESTIGLS